MDRWKSCTSRYGAKATWHFFYEPVVKPVDGYVSLAKDFTAVTWFVTVDIHLDQDGMCCLRYGTLHGRPSPIDNALVELLRRDIPVFAPSRMPEASNFLYPATTHTHTHICPSEISF
jgi:hypothetical protein